MAGIKITTFNIIPLPREGAQDVRPFSETQPPYGQAFLGGRRDRPLPAPLPVLVEEGAHFLGPKLDLLNCLPSAEYVLENLT